MPAAPSPHRCFSVVTIERRSEAMRQLPLGYLIAEKSSLLALVSVIR